MIFWWALRLATKLFAFAIVCYVIQEWYKSVMSRREEKLDQILEYVAINNVYLRRLVFLFDTFLHQPTRIRIHFKGATMPATLLVGQTVSAFATEADAQGVNVPIANSSTLSWSSSDATIASIATNPDGTSTTTAVAVGTASVTVTDSANGLTTTDTVTVTAAPDVPVSIAINFGTPQ